MSKIKEITNKYPTTNDEWSYRCMIPDIGIYRSDLNTYLNDVFYGIKNVTVYKSEEYVGVVEFFVRQSDRDDFYDNPALFTHKGHNSFNYVGNSDPWNRMFKVYKNGINTDVYKCRAIFDDVGKPLVYVLSTSVEGHTIYCVERINI